MIACTGCLYEHKCAEKRLACRAYASGGRRGSNPSKKWFMALHGNNIDYANRRIHAMADDKPIHLIAEWIRENVSSTSIPDITFPESIRCQILRLLWRQMPVERLELEDFVG